MEDLLTRMKDATAHLAQVAERIECPRPPPRQYSYGAPCQSNYSAPRQYGPPRTAQVNTTGVTCFGCQEPGHIRRDCPHDQNRYRPATGVNAQPVQPQVRFNDQAER